MHFLQSALSHRNIKIGKLCLGGLTFSLKGSWRPPPQASAWLRPCELLYSLYSRRTYFTLPRTYVIEVDIDVVGVEDKLNVAAACVDDTRLERDVSVVRRETSHWSGTRLARRPTAVRRTRTTEMPRSVRLQVVVIVTSEIRCINNKNQIKSNQIWL